MIIKELDKDSQQDYTLLAGKNGSVFSSLEWVKLFGADLKTYGIFNNDKKLIGGFSLYYQTVKGLKRITNAPYTPTIGLFYVNSSQNKSNKLTADKEIVSDLAHFLNTKKNSIITISLPDSIIDTQPFFWEDFKVVPIYTYKIDLSQSVEQLTANLSTFKRTNLRKNETDGIVVEKSCDNKIIKELVIKTFDRKEKSTNIKYLDKILFDFANTSNSFSYIAYAGKQPVACAFCVYDRQTAYYLMGGYDSQNKHRGAGVESLWRSILEAKKMGLSYFDFEGSMLPEVEKYFRGFGAELTPFYTINKASLPMELLLKVRKRNRF